MTPWSLALVLAAGVRTLVLPFENLSGDSAHDWRGSAFEEAVSAHLFSAGYDVVDFASRNRQLRANGFAPSEAISRASAIVLARDLDAERLVLGEFRVVDERIELTAREIDLAKGATVGVIADRGLAREFARLTNLVAKNLFRLERDAPPPGFDARAAGREKIPLEALEASARSRVSFDAQEQRRLLERAVRLASDYVEARLVLGRLHLDEGRARDAIDVLASVRGQGRIYEAAYFDLGLAYLAAGEPESALEIFQNLSGRPGAGAPAANNLGVALMRRGRLPEAREAFESALELGGEAKSYVFNVGWSSWRSGKGARAFELFEKVAGGDPLDAKAHLLLGAASASQARPALAERCRGTALTLDPFLEGVDPATVEGWARTVRSAEDAGSLSGAIAPVDYEEDVVALEELLDARELRSRGRTAEAISLLQRSLYRDPNAVDSRRELADVYRAEGALEQAASEMSIVLWTEPSAEGHVELARIYLEMEEPAKAFEQIELALALDPGHLEALEIRDEIAPEDPTR